MKIFLNDVTEKTVDKFEDAFIHMVSVHSNIWEGTTSDTYRYEIEVEEEPVTGDGYYALEDVAIIYKNGSYLFEIVNASQYSTVEIRKNEVESIVFE